ncbi:MAG: exodeoxyribonuclease V subunit gamma, partial [Rhodococcus sp. (in: high G+C Gram-positive bacteria)]|nr:exodeoxyribonuclease V subunit gamma [Rhodococcus sp. (in: high G+C Gram-positive bacteria)]MDX5453135.1 exodeoxyribonuclease V subunit gamma [Rhodococcus sp. (in: high G+C Gram-positive bacteria)]
MIIDAYDRLSAAVADAKAGRPLAPVTVVVPGHGVGRDVTAHLARTGGLANTHVRTLEQFVEHLARPALAPRAPLRYPLLEAAVQKALLDDPGVFADVADQSATAESLAHASWQLCALDVPCPEDANPLVDGVFRIHRRCIAAHAHRFHV